MMQHLSRAWSACAPAIGNHLWQSTLFLVLVALLALVLRQNHARERHALWLAASVKFLLPFSVLVALGRYLSWSHPAATHDFGLYLVFNQAAQPFHDSVGPQISNGAGVAVARSSSLADFVPAVFAGIWLCGVAVIVVNWCMRWRRIAGLVRESQPLEDGREFNALRRVQGANSLRRDIEIRLSAAFLEPGIFGILRPTLVWPEGVSEQLSDGQLDAIIGHEVSHVRRWDNLAAAVHLLVQAIFWFHPLVWWMGARLVEERERACDQEVLDAGAEPRVYAESIVKICEFCLQSPLPCVSGVTGADLKQRIVGIMSHRSARKLNLPRKLLVVGAALGVTALPIGFGLAHGLPMRTHAQVDAITGNAQFEVASIRPDRDATGVFSFGWFTPSTFTAKGATVQFLIRQAYQVADDQIVGVPSWLKSERYDIRAKVPSSIVDQIAKLDFEQSNQACFRMLQHLLTDRFKLTFHKETKELPVFELVIAKNGPKLHQAKPGDTYPDGIKDFNGKGHENVMRFGRGLLIGQGIPVADFIKMLSEQRLALMVVDKTGLTAKYDFTLKWNPEDLNTGLTEGDQRSNSDAPSADSTGPSLFTALQEQLGLKLERRKVSVDVIVIDHVEEPSPN